MKKKYIYYFSNDGSVKCYFHFFFAVLIPLIYYDIKTKSKYRYIVKINMNNLFNILKYIFTDRIENDYINNKNTINDRFDYFDLYITLLKNKNNDDIVLSAYDIFRFDRYKLVTKNYNHEEYKKLKMLFIDYYYYKDKNKKPLNYNFIEDEYIKNKLRYKQLDITNKYIKLKKIRPYIIEFFESKTQNILDAPSIVLIERKIPNTIIPYNLCDTSGGQRRFLLNHTEIKNKLHEKYKNKFTNVVLEDCNIYEQFTIFRNAKIIIAQHGSGLVNIFFSKNIKLIELAPKQFSILDYYCFENLSKFCKFNYLRIKYNQMSIKELIDVNNKYNLFNKNDIKNVSNDIKIYEKQKNKYNISPLILFIKTSGTKINVNQIIKALEN